MRAGDTHETVVLRHINERYGSIDEIAVDLSVTGLVVVVWIVETIGEFETTGIAMESLLFTFRDGTLLL